MNLVQLKAPDGLAVLFNPAHVAAVLPCQDQTGRAAIGVCGVIVAGGAAPVLVSMTPESAARALGFAITVPAALSAGFNGKLTT